jgi:hypothetical protein
MKTTKEKAGAGKPKGTGINKPVVKESVPQVVAKTKVGKISQKQKL